MKWSSLVSAGTFITALVFAAKLAAQPLALPPKHDVGDLTDDTTPLQTLATAWRDQARSRSLPSQAAAFATMMDREPQCQADKKALSCLNALLVHPAITLNLTNSANWEPATNTPQPPVKALVDGVLQQLDQGLSQALDNVATGLGVPALTGVVQNFAETALDSLIHIEDLEEPQTLGYRIALPELGWLQPRLTTYATPLPELNPILKKRLSEEGRAQLLTAKEGGLDFGDDYYVAIDVSVNGPYFGRKLEDHLADRQRLTKTLNLSRDLQNQRDAAALLQLDNATDRRALAIATAALHQSEELVWSRIGNARLNEFWKFIHNQPQLDLQFKRLKREDVVGADASSFRLGFSSGLINLTWLKLFSGCDAKLGNGEDCLNAYTRWSESWLLKHGAGIAAYYEQGDIADLSIELPPLAAGLGDLLLGQLLPGEALGLGFSDDDPNRFVIDGGRYQRYGWAIGATLTNPEWGQKNSRSLRADFGTDYYRYDRDPVRLDHEVMRFTLTWRWGDLSLPLNLMYRSKTEFEANLNDTLAVGIGLSYRH